jgi:hypothetical protein
LANIVIIPSEWKPTPFTGGRSEAAALSVNAGSGKEKAHRLQPLVAYNLFYDVATTVIDAQQKGQQGEGQRQSDEM